MFGYRLTAKCLALKKTLNIANNDFDNKEERIK